ncbi:MANSC domain-containing protein 1 [Ranitomeya variabilis]|uniref:MANSC domain-containing protein 1 n=1 Tax=Ranitomeya variabilis TaxID=490064 RepID=UPI0040573485
MGLSTLGLLCSVLFSILAHSGSQKCVPQAMPDMVIDISRAVASGARFTDPLKVSNVEECLSACCGQLDAGGDRSCNLLVFDARTPGMQKCYIFHCPTLNSCPLLSSPGVLSYSFWSDTSRPGKTDPGKEEQQKPKSGDRSKVQGSPEKTSSSGDGESTPSDLNRKTSSVIVSQLSAEHEVKKELGDPSKIITSQLLHLADKIDQHLEKMESKSKDDDLRVPTIQTTPVPKEKKKKLPPKAKAAKSGKDKKPEAPQTHRPIAAVKATSTTPKRTTARLSTAAPHPVPRTNASHVVPPAAAHNVSGISNVRSSKLPASDHTAVPTLPTTYQTRPPLGPSWTSPWTGVKLSTKSNDQPSAGDKGETPGRVLPESRLPAQEEPAVSLEEAPGKVAGSEGAFPPLGDKSGLVAALVFGMLFLMVVIGLVSRKVSEVRRRHRYTKLDYLINGMYVDT